MSVKSEARFSIKELNKLFKTRLKDGFSVSICTDSRIIKPNQIFLPLKGELFDGHNYINKIFDKSSVETRHGASLFSFCEKAKVSKVKNKYRHQLIVVNNTLDAYHKLANYYRKKINPKVIAITGSSGKTTTKDLTASVLSSHFKVHKTEANFNNEIGLPKTILEMPPGTDVLVLELAMRGKGEIEVLSKTAEPDIAVIINIGTAHIGRLGSQKAVINAKCEILKHLKKNGLAVLFNDKRLLKTAAKIWNGKTTSFDLKKASQIIFKDGRSFFTLKNMKNLSYETYSIGAMGNIHILNSLVSILIGKYLGLLKYQIQKGLLTFKIPPGTGRLVKISKDIYLIDESYNANPDSVKAAVGSLVKCWGNGYKKILILGELAELGGHESKLLHDLSRWLKDKELSTVITVGKKLKPFFTGSNVKNAGNPDECCAILKRLLTPHSVTLVKGSRVARLEKLVEKLLSN